MARTLVSSSSIGSSLGTPSALTEVLTGVGGGAFVPTAGLDVVECARLRTSGVSVPTLSFLVRSGAMDSTIPYVKVRRAPELIVSWIG
jgi:hypothetical protein